MMARLGSAARAVLESILAQDSPEGDDIESIVVMLGDAHGGLVELRRGGRALETLAVLAEAGTEALKYGA